VNATLSDPDRIITPSPRFCQLVGISETTRWRQRKGEGQTHSVSPVASATRLATSQTGWPLVLTERRRRTHDARAARSARAPRAIRCFLLAGEEPLHSPSCAPQSTLRFATPTARSALSLTMRGGERLRHLAVAHVSATAPTGRSSMGSIQHERFMTGNYVRPHRLSPHCYRGSGDFWQTAPGYD
jgi:hypothetical protein